MTTNEILLVISWALSMAFAYQAGVSHGVKAAYMQVNASLQKAVDFLECVFIKKERKENEQ